MWVSPLANRHRNARHATVCLVVVSALAGACARQPAPAPRRLVELFAAATVTGTPTTAAEDPAIGWDFATEPAELGGWFVVGGARELALVDGRLTGRAAGRAVIAAPLPLPMPDDKLHAVEIRLRASGGAQLGAKFDSAEEFDAEALRDDFAEAEGRSLGFGTADLVVPLLPGDEAQTYTLTMAASTMMPSLGLGQVRHLIVMPTEEPGAEFAIESIRVISRRQHLAAIDSGVGWHGMGEIYRESIVSRAPEQVAFDVDVPADASLELALATVESYPVTFTVHAAGGGVDRELLRRTVTTPDRWDGLQLDLGELRGATRLTFGLESTQDGAIGYWGTPVIRISGATAARAFTPDAVAALGDAAAPRGVIVILTDTLRRDHLEAYGYDRATAPTLARLADEGTLFVDAIAQGTWTKVSVPSILTSLYASTHGIVDLPDRLPASVITLAENFQAAGYATFATSSVPFTGKLTNLHQGIDVLHEVTSVGELPHSQAKTARTFVDRLLPWLEDHRDVPFFVFLHVFDPHSPLEPYDPYATLFATDADNELQYERLEAVREHIADDHMRRDGMPTEEELAVSGVDRAEFLRVEHAWYDGSIRGMDVEVGRLMERLQTLGLADDTLLAVVADHGEEFLEHGRHFHGFNAYGEMVNVPMFVRWPGVVPAGTRVERTVQTIDLYPTLLELAGLPVPAGIQGQSLAPVMADPQAPSSLGYRAGAAFTERIRPPSEDDLGTWDSWAIVVDGWKLVQNAAQPDDVPEYQLFDHVEDPLDLTDVAAEYPDIVEQLAAELTAWREMAVAARIEEASIEGLSPAELDRLRSLGYIQ